MRQRALPCGCIVTDYPGHVNTVMCEEHQREHFARQPRPGQARHDNLDLVGG